MGQEHDGIPSERRLLGRGWRVAIVVAALAVVALAAPAVSAAATFTVNTIDDLNDGSCDEIHCSLREAINAANASAGADTIAFDIVGPPPHSIKPLSQLPTVTDPAVIDGSTEPDYAGSPVVELDGSFAGPVIGGLDLVAGDSTVRAFAINRFQGPGVRLRSLGGNAVDGNFVGTDVSGLVSQPNDRGVQIDTFAGAGNTIGGTSGVTPGGSCTGACNLISGNTHGISMNSVSAGGNTVQGNYIGTDVTGTADVGNLGMGVEIRGAGGHTIGGTANAARNVISGNASGVTVVGTSGNDIVGNYIGTDATGTVQLPNDNAGIEMGGSGSSPASNNAVGGPNPGERNVISGNGVGVWISGFDDQQNSVRGNYIGTDVTGTADLGNRLFGVQIHGHHNTVGGSSAGEGNLISGNEQYGILLTFDASSNTVEGNSIGVAADGGTPLGNAALGVVVAGTAHDNRIGGGASGAGNVIAFNGTNPPGDGVRIEQTAVGNAILGNAIFDNAGLGIDLVPPDGVTPNDPGDGDSGANNLQNFPELTSASSSGGSTTIEGTLNSEPNTTYRLEFFANGECDPSGHGEGKTFLAAEEVTTDAGGNATFSVTVSDADPGQFITATATDPDGNTSEFSGCQVVEEGGPGPRVTQHFRSYQADGGPASRELVTLRDQFGEQRVRLGAARLLMTPSIKQREEGEPEGIVRPGEHLKCYRISGRAVEREVSISNQFTEGTQLTVGKPTDLCAPASKVFEGEPGEPPADLNHYKCYAVSRTPSVAETVQLADQFGADSVRVQRVSRLCNPVEKQRAGGEPESPPHPTEHLACYQIREPAGFAARTVFTRDQFGPEPLEITKPSRLCVPSEKIEAPPTET